MALLKDSGRLPSSMTREIMICFYRIPARISSEIYREISERVLGLVSECIFEGFHGRIPAALLLGIYKGISRGVTRRNFYRNLLFCKHLLHDLLQSFLHDVFVNFIFRMLIRGWTWKSLLDFW